jgi:hypothetical protein
MSRALSGPASGRRGYAAYYLAGQAADVLSE